MGAGEALAMPRLVLVGNTSRGDDLIALDAARGKLLLVAAGAIDLLLPRDEGLGPNGRLADAAAEAILVPLPGFILHFLGACAENFAAAIAAGRKLGIVTVSTVDLIRLGSKLLVHQ